MPTEFVMPKLGLTMEEGTIREWLVADGDAVTPGDAVLVIETDKVETDVESPAAGRLHRIAAVGETIGCGVVIGYLLADGEAPPTALSTAATTAAPPPPAGPPPGSLPGSPATAPAAVPAPIDRPGGRVVASPNARRVAAERGIPLAAVRGTGPGGRIVSEDVDDAAALARTHTAAAPAPAAAPNVAATGTSVPATAGARLLADLLGVDLRRVPARAGDGRRQRDDVAAYVRQQLEAIDRADRGDRSGPAPSTQSTAPGPKTLASAPVLQEPTATVPLTGMRGAIATRMHQSLAEMAQLTLHLDASMDAVVADRTARRAAGSAPGYTDYVIAAVARALRDHPELNAQVTADGIALLPAIHVGMAVALDDGLLVPVVHDAGALDLDTLAAETSRLAEAARAGKLRLADLEGGTFSVTSLGGFGVDGFTPVINPPNVAILGVGRLRATPTIVDGTLQSSTSMTLSLTWDHRALDGAPAARFASRVAELLADPAALDSPRPLPQV